MVDEPESTKDPKEAGQKKLTKTTPEREQESVMWLKQKVNKAKLADRALALFTLTIAAATFAYVIYARAHVILAMVFLATILVAITVARKHGPLLKQKVNDANLADWAMVLLTFIIGATTFVYTRRQWEITGSQLYQMGDDSVTARRVQWAWIDVPQSIDVHMTVENGRVTHWTPEITVVNDGDTGTYNTLEIVNVQVFDKEMPEGFDYPDTGKWQNSDLGPHETELFDAQPIRIADVQSVQKGGHIYVYGLAEYWDVFQFYANKEAKQKYQRHLREFCYELRLDSPIGDVTSPKYGLPRRMILYGSHNCTDGDCPDYEEKLKSLSGR